MKYLLIEIKHHKHLHPSLPIPLVCNPVDFPKNFNLFPKVFYDTNTWNKTIKILLDSWTKCIYLDFRWHQVFIITMSICHPQNFVVSCFNNKAKPKDKHVSPWVITKNRCHWEVRHLYILGFQSTRQLLYSNKSSNTQRITLHTLIILQYK